MSAPVLWIVFPIFAGAGLFFLRRLYRLTVTLGTALALLLALLAWQLPIDQAVTLGPVSFKLGDTLNVLGRQFTLPASAGPPVLVVCIRAAIWSASAYTGDAGRIFVPLGLVITGLLTAVPAVNPFLYAAMLVELIALVGVIMLSRPGQPVRRGALRFLIFQTLGMPFILFTGWLLTGVEASPGELALVSRAAILLGIGFAFWLAIFPFHTWLPMVAEEAHPLAVGFIFLMLPLVVMLFGLGFLDRYAWLRNAAELNGLLQLAGVIMVLTGGLWAGFQRHLGRMLGFATMVEIGKALLALSLPGGLPLFFAMLLPRTVALAVWSLSLTVFQSYPDLPAPRHLDEGALRGLGRKLPLATASLSLAHLSIAGLPLLAGFPIMLTLSRNLATSSLLVAILTLVGMVGLLAGGLRSLSVLLTGTDTDPQGWQMQERGAVVPFLAIGAVVLLLIGLFPQLFLPPLADLAQVFGRLNTLP